MFFPDRLGARVNNWLLVLVGALAFILYQLVQAPFYAMATAWIAFGIVLSAALGVLLPLYFLVRQLGIPFREQFQLHRPEWGRSLAVIGSTLSLIPALEILTAWMGRRFPPEEYYLEFVEKLRPDDVFSFAAVAIAISVAVPIAEEFLFRGLLQRVLLRHSRPGVALALVALLFGSVHPLYAMPGVVALGVLFGVLAWRLDSLVYPILAHAAWNLANLVLLQFAPDELDLALDSPFAGHSLLWFLVSLALFVFCSRFWFPGRGEWRA